jgi:hypothetical protein
MGYIGIEQNTDLKHPETAIRRFRSEREARRWLDEYETRHAFPGAARNDIPPIQQNWHVRLRRVIVTPPGWRFPSKAEQAKYVRDRWASSYRRREADCIADAAWRDRDGELEK